MSYVCDQLEGTVSAAGSQGCAVWVEAVDYSFFAISWEQAQDLALPFTLCCAAIFLYRILKRSM